jgi:hypothetical protein
MEPDQMPTIHDQACEMLANLEERHRSNHEEFMCLKSDAPEWMVEAIYKAHGDMTPNDWRYHLIRDALFAIATAADDDDEDGFDDRLSDELAGAVDVYTGRLTDWLASNLERVAYCDRDAKEYGPFKSITGWIQAGQLCELREIAESIMATFRDREDQY